MLESFALMVSTGPGSQSTEVQVWAPLLTCYGSREAFTLRRDFPRQLPLFEAAVNVSKITFVLSTQCLAHSKLLLNSCCCCYYYSLLLFQLINFGRLNSGNLTHCYYLISKAKWVSAFKQSTWKWCFRIQSTCGLVTICVAQRCLQSAQEAAKEGPCMCSGADITKLHSC